jgi:integrase
VVVLDGQQVMQLLGAARDVQERALFALAITTGMRQGEIFALSWADVEFVAGTVSVRATLTEDLDGKLVRSEPKTTKSRRVIYLPALALKALRAHQAERQAEQGFVFTSAETTRSRRNAMAAARSRCTMRSACTTRADWTEARATCEKCSPSRGFTNNTCYRASLPNEKRCAHPFSSMSHSRGTAGGA